MDAISVSVRRSEGYRLEGHRVQREMQTVHAEAAETDDSDLQTGVDGCGVVTFALPLERMAHAFSRFEQLEGGARVADAMRANPELIRGHGATDTRPMQTLPGWTPQGRAEGLPCGSRHGVGAPLKTQDGPDRAPAPAAQAL